MIAGCWLRNRYTAERLKWLLYTSAWSGVWSSSCREFNRNLQAHCEFLLYLRAQKLLKPQPRNDSAPGDGEALWRTKLVLVPVSHRSRTANQCAF